MVKTSPTGAQAKPDPAAQIATLGLDLETQYRSIFENAIEGIYQTSADGVYLRANPALTRNFVEEALRYESPVQGLLRRATRDVEIGGTLIPKDAMVIVRYGAANLDAAKFECPHAFDIERRNAGAHLAFGNGTHFCVGRLLAKQEMLTGFTILLERLADIELARPLPDPPHLPSLLLHGLKELPIRFRKVR